MIVRTTGSFILFFLIFFCPELNAQSPDSLSQPVTLSQLCTIYKTDKCADEHNYIEVYEELFEPLKYSTRSILEIGILHGYSHRMWKTYFNNAEIYGMDIEDKSFLRKEGIHTFLGDQSNRKDLRKMMTTFKDTFDIIIDDGGHSMEQQQVSFGYLFPYVRSGGIFIIEDVHTSLPQFYKSDFFGVNEDRSNTTLKMLQHYIETSVIESEYIMKDEKDYLHRNIGSVQLHYRTNAKHSIMCIITKKED